MNFTKKEEKALVRISNYSLEGLQKRRKINVILFIMGVLAFVIPALIYYQEYAGGQLTEDQFKKEIIRTLNTVLFFSAIFLVTYSSLFYSILIKKLTSDKKQPPKKLN